MGKENGVALAPDVRLKTDEEEIDAWLIENEPKVEPALVEQMSDIELSKAERESVLKLFHEERDLLSARSMPVYSANMRPDHYDSVNQDFRYKLVIRASIQSRVTILGKEIDVLEKPGFEFTLHPRHKFVELVSADTFLGLGEVPLAGAIRSNPADEGAHTAITQA